MGTNSMIEWCDPAIFTPAIRDRFWSYVRKGPGCWLWLRGTFDNGYGQFRVGPRKMRTHRVSYLLSCGQIPAGLRVCHTCDTPLCVNPDHLWLGTDADNVHDCQAKGRGRSAAPAEISARTRGELNHFSILSEKDVRTIRRLHGPGKSYKALASEFGVASSTIAAIIRRETWRHI